MPNIRLLKVALPIAVVFGFIVLLFAQDEKPSPDEEHRIKESIEKLNALYFDDREDAKNALIKMGKKALPYLTAKEKEAREESDPSERLIDSIKHIRKAIEWKSAVEENFSNKISDDLRKNISDIARMVVSGNKDQIESVLEDLTGKKLNDNRDSISQKDKPKYTVTRRELERIVTEILKEEVKDYGLKLLLIDIVEEYYLRKSAPGIVKFFKGEKNLKENDEETNKEKDLREKIHTALANLHTKNVVPEIIPLLQEKDKEVRRYACDHLTYLGNYKEAVPELLNWLEDKDERYVSSAILYLGFGKAKEAVPKLIPLLKNPSSKIRAESAKALGDIRVTEAVDELIRLAKDDKDSSVRNEAINALADIGDKKAISMLLEAISKEPVDFARFMAASGLGKLREEAILPDLIKILDDKDPKTREYTLEALGYYRNPKLIPQIVKLTQDKIPSVRKRAIWCLAKIGGEESTEALIKMLESENNEEVLCSIVNILKALGAKDTAPLLLQILQTKKFSDLKWSNPQWIIINALGEFGYKEAVPYLKKMVQDPNESIRRNAIESLANIEGKNIIPELREILKKEKSVNVLRKIVNILSNLDAKEAVPEIESLLASKDIEVPGRTPSAEKGLKRHYLEWLRLDVLSSLSKLAPQKAIPEWQKLLDDKDILTAMQSAVALGELGQEEAVDYLIEYLDIALYDWLVAHISAVLNKFRESQMYEKLEKAVSSTEPAEYSPIENFGTTFTIKNLPSELKKHFGVDVEIKNVDERILEDEIQIQTRKGTTLKEALDHILSISYPANIYLTYICEKDKVIITDQGKAILFWKGWWEKEKEKFLKR